MTLTMTMKSATNAISRFMDVNFAWQMGIYPVAAIVAWRTCGIEAIIWKRFFHIFHFQRRKKGSTCHLHNKKNSMRKTNWIERRLVGTLQTQILPNNKWQPCDDKRPIFFSLQIPSRKRNPIPDWFRFSWLNFSTVNFGANCSHRVCDCEFLRMYIRSLSSFLSLRPLNMEIFRLPMTKAGQSIEHLNFWMKSILHEKYAPE